MNRPRVKPEMARRIRLVTRPLRWIAIGMILWGSWEVWRDSRSLPAVSDTELASQAEAMGRQLGVVIGVSTPEKFQAEINQPLVEVLTIRSADPAKAMLALPALLEAMKLYPRELLNFYLSGVFLADSVAVEGNEGAGTYANGAIYLSVSFVVDPEDAKQIALGFHHEFSSLLYLGALNEATPGDLWDAQNPEEFRYLRARKDVLEAAGRYAPSWQASEWYAQGFVSDYGRSSRENDINTYAELLMGDPQELVQLASKWPRIDAKARILARFYATIDDALGAQLRSTPARVFLDDGSIDAVRTGIQISRDTQLQLRDALGAAFSFAGSAAGGIVQKYAVGIAETLETH